MDFNRLVRKDLQFLCKLNKIPANRSNVAMAEALTSLPFVKGIEKFDKSTESSVAESSVESPDKDVVTSPKTTRTGRRKQARQGSGFVLTPTRRKNRVHVASVQRIYNTRLSARLLKKELMESEKRECVEAVKISSYCDVVPDNDPGKAVVDIPIQETEAFIQILSSQKDGSEDVGIDFSFSGTELLIESSARGIESSKEGNENILNTEVICLTKMNSAKAVVETPIQETKAVIQKFFSQRKRSNDKKGNDKCFNSDVTGLTNVEGQILSCKGSESVGVESQNLENVDDDLVSKVTVGTKLDSDVLKMDGFKMDVGETFLEMPSDENLALVELPFHEKKDDVGVGICLSETVNIAEVLANDDTAKNLVDMLSYDSNAVVDDVPVQNLSTDEPTNEVELLQMDSGKAIVEIPIQETEDFTQILFSRKEGSKDVGGVFTFSGSELLTESSERGIESSKEGTEINLDTEVICLMNMNGENLSCKGSDKAGVESIVSEIKQESECSNEINDGWDLHSFFTGKDVTTEILSNEVKLVQTNTAKSVVYTPIQETKAVIQIFSSQNKNLSTVSDDVGVNFSLETKTFIESSKKGNDQIPNTEDIGSTNMEGEILSSKDDVDLLSLPEIDMTTEVLAHEGSDNVAVEPSFSEIEQQGESLDQGNVNKDLESKVTVGTNLEYGVQKEDVEGLEMDNEEVFLEIPNDKYTAVVDLPHHKKKGPFDFRFSFSENEIQSESSKLENAENLDTQVIGLTDIKVVALNGKGDKSLPVEVSEMDTDESVVEKLTDERKGDLPIFSMQENGSIDVEFSSSENEFQSESSKRGNGKNLDLQVIALTDLEAVALNVFDIVGVTFSPSEIGRRSELDWKNADRDLVVKDTTESYLKSKVLRNKVDWSCMDSAKNVEDMPGDDCKSDKLVDNTTTEVLMNEVELLQMDSGKAVGDLPVHETDESADTAVSHSVDSKESEILKEQLKMESSEEVNFSEGDHDSVIQPKSAENVSPEDVCNKAIASDLKSSDFC